MACLVVADADYDQLEITNASECNCSDPAYWYNELCDCDYPEATSIALVHDALPLGIWYGLVLILGATGNSLVITVVIRYRKMRSFTNILLASMSTADLLILLFCLPVQYCKYLSHSWIMGAFLCVAFHYVELMTMICSLMTMTTISIQRYAAVAFPMKSMSFRSKKRALKTVLVTWLLSALLAVPILFGQELEVYKTPKNVTVSWCWRRFSDHYWEKIFVLYQFVILYLGPFATTAISYLLLIQRLYFGEANSLLQENVSARSVGNANGSTAEHQQTYQAKSSRRFCPRREQSKKVTKMLVIILLLFFVCWTPTLVDEFLVAFDYLCHTSPTTTLKYMRMIFAIMKFSNSCINPIVYAFMSNSFRTTFIIVCNPLCLKRRHSLPVDSRTHNRRDSPISERSLRLHSDIRPTELLDGAQSVFRKQRLMKVKYAKN
ncbi:G-protein coupled receptor 54 [Trichinella pseudospiralis]|uniref:G-protein coupled receptor 54 n=2 Tax=Trichinella pseudospiralis TaxID=6337 RepID=A0A0V1EEM0_TRIPS|nr:G-protein coupled receptor 54 [Trichinella pseudospiralis]KRZ19834.1 G-protein coupled receptor 54 [Trichinella pseudospiralis]